MRVVISRVLARTRLHPVGRAERGVRKGVTIVPRRGVRVAQAEQPLQGSEGAVQERVAAGHDALAEVP
jgi:hypothetical protein